MPFLDPSEPAGEMCMLGLQVVDISGVGHSIAQELVVSLEHLACSSCLWNCAQ